MMIFFFFSDDDDIFYVNKFFTSHYFFFVQLYISLLKNNRKYIFQFETCMGSSLFIKIENKNKICIFILFLKFQLYCC